MFAHLRTQNLGCVYCKLGVHLLQNLTCTRFMLVCKFAKLLVCLQLVVLQLRIVITLICKQISAGLVANVVFANSALHVCKQVVQASHFGLRFFLFFCLCKLGLYVCICSVPMFCFSQFVVHILQI